MRTWLQILIYLDRSANQWRLAGDWLAVLSRTVRQSSANLRRQIGWLVEKRWLMVAEQATDGSPLVLKSPNWLKYNRTQEHKRNGTIPDQGAVEDPLLSFPSPSLSVPSPKDKEEEKSAVPVSKKRSPPLAPDSEWLEELQRQPIYQHVNVKAVFQKCWNWCEVNKASCTRRRFINWLNREPTPMQPVALGGQCEARVQRGNFLKPCGEPAVGIIGKRQVCQLHKEEHDARRSTETPTV